MVYNNNNIMIVIFVFTNHTVKEDCIIQLLIKIT